MSSIEPFEYNLCHFQNKFQPNRVLMILTVTHIPIAAQVHTAAPIPKSMAVLTEVPMAALLTAQLKGRGKHVHLYVIFFDRRVSHIEQTIILNRFCIKEKCTSQWRVS